MDASGFTYVRRNKDRFRHSASLEGLHYPQSPSFWFADGDIVLGTPNMLFRVHLAKLLSASPVFQRIFKLGESGCTSPLEKGTGCTFMVPLEEYSGEEVGVMLHSVYDMDEQPGYQLTTLKQRVGRLPNIVSLFEMSQDYEMPILFDMAISVLNDAYPPLGRFKLLSHEVPQGYNDFFALAIALNYNHRNILPCVLMMICRKRFLDFLRELDSEWQDEDGNVYKISESDSEALSRGRRGLHDEFYQNVWTPVAEHREWRDCTIPEECRRNRTRQFNQVYRTVSMAIVEPVWADWQRELCLVCYGKLRERYEEALRKMEEALYTHFEYFLGPLLDTSTADPSVAA